ncbi:uncharacterized protein LOC107268227 isoform X2 [Cephus cinctus]|uniref:Uncharacterized protein LOC107268227 isoform X2 n=1 Tax=Cephus cinctus TaxID=211228 RepID=A0AAJ7W1Q6_CEPCN|nr:uncharacterized protein LOC107268227 isoform X2 [Cephus cinctus]
MYRNDRSSESCMSGCNCNASVEMCAGSGGCCQFDLPPGPSAQKKERQRPQNSGCEPPRCARMTPSSESKEKWEYPNYEFSDYGQHGMKHYIGYDDRSALQSQQPADYEVKNRFNDYRAHNANMKIQPNHPLHRPIIQQRNCEVRVAGGCDWPRTFNQDSCPDYHYDNVPADEPI